jgi:copper resistance protein C
MPTDPPRSPEPRRARRLLAVLALTIAGAVPAVALAPAASAHDQVVSTSPTDGSAVAGPTRVAVTFSEDVLAVEGANRIVVTGPAGDLTGELTARGKVVEITFATPLPGGSYRVRWRAASADGHPVSGTFAFTVRAAAATATPLSTATAAGPTSASPTPTAPTVGAAPTPTATLTSSPSTQASGSDGGWGPWLLGGLVVAALAASGLIWSARRQVARERATDDGSRE